MAPEDMAKQDGDEVLEDLDLEQAIGEAEELAGSVNSGLGDDVEELINAESGEDCPTVGPRRYDFHRPRSISKTFAQNLQAVGENVAKTATTDFTSLMRTVTKVEYLGTRQCSFEEYREDLPKPTCAAMVALPPFKGASLFHLDLGMCFVFLKKLMGGKPEPESVVREFTEIERNINAGLIGRFLEIFKKSCAKWIDLNAKLTSLENNPDYLSGIADGESLIILKFMIKLETVEGPFELALPQAAFSPVREIFDPQETVEMRTPSERQDDRRRVMDMVQTTSSDLVVELGQIATNLDEILNLSIGDTLHLKQSVSTPLVVKIEGQAAWLGEAGRVGQNRAIKLIEKLNKE